MSELKGPRGPEEVAVRHILSAPAIASRTAPFIGPDGFDFAALAAEQERMSGGEALLVRIAAELWRAEKQVGLWELPRRLDQGNFRRVVEALAIARGDVPLAGLAALGEQRAA
jgi:hypothetical protein